MTTQIKQLPLEERTAISAACTRADELVAERRFDQAIAAYDHALELIPEPRSAWPEATRVFAGLANACFLGGYGASARDALEYVFFCPGADALPLLHLRYGQVLFDEGLLERAATELARALADGGRDLFQGEDEKYWLFLGSRSPTAT